MTGNELWWGIVRFSALPPISLSCYPPAIRQPSPSSDMWGLPALLPVLCSKTHNGGSAMKILHNTSPYSTVISRASHGGKTKKSMHIPSSRQLNKVVLLSTTFLIFYMRLKCLIFRRAEQTEKSSRHQLTQYLPVHPAVFCQLNPRNSY